MELTILKFILPYINWQSLGIFAAYTWFLLIGFFVYVTAVTSWPRMLIGIKILVSPVIVIFGVADVIFDTVAGTIMFGLEPPGWFEKRFTFSARCEYHVNDAGFKGVIADAFCFTLNTISPGHCDKRRK